MTKRAADVPLTRLTTTYMGNAQFGTHLDVGRRFGEDNQWGVRANGVWRNGEGNVDGGRQRLGLGSLGVDYAGSRLRWSLDALTTSGKTTEFRPQIAFRGGITQVPAVPDNRSSFYPGAELTDKAKTVMSRLEYDLNDNTTVYGSVGYSDTSTDQNFPTAVTRPSTCAPTRRAISRSTTATTTNTTRRRLPKSACARASRPAASATRWCWRRTRCSGRPATSTN
jgi:iron complex outermembrane receptor protein